MQEFSKFFLGIHSLIGHSWYILFDLAAGMARNWPFVAQIYAISGSC